MYPSYAQNLFMVHAAKNYQHCSFAVFLSKRKYCSYHNRLSVSENEFLTKFPRGFTSSALQYPASTQITPKIEKKEIRAHISALISTIFSRRVEIRDQKGNLDRAWLQNQ